MKVEGRRGRRGHQQAASEIYFLEIMKDEESHISLSNNQNYVLMGCFLSFIHPN